MDRIAHAQQVPPALLSKILQTLVKAKILRSHKGYGGGFVLAVEPDKLTLARVIQLIDGPFTVFECLTDHDFCTLCSACKLQNKFRELQQSMLEQLQATNIAQLVEGGDRAPHIAARL